jgi:hypothetical protein
MRTQNKKRVALCRLGLSFLACTLLYAACTTSSTSVAGGGTRGGNPVMLGKIMTVSKMPARDAIITLVPELYDPVRDAPLPSSLTGTTNEEGEYRFADMDTGTYNIEAVSAVTRERALIYGVHLTVDPVTVPTDTVRSTGTIKIVLPDGLDTAAGGYFYVPGTRIAALFTKNSDHIVLDSVPAGPVPSICYAVRNSIVAPAHVRDSVTITPGGTTTVTNIAWKYLKKLYLNTTVSGAGVAGNVEKFPVLVRLNTGNFNFNQAQKNGNDIRFTKSNGDTLPFEIERWDSVSGLAEIWVKADTVYGNDSTHYFMMYWGLRPASPASNVTAVFDTANGYAGVWHLGPGLSDATSNNHNGTDSSTADTAGIIGRCRMFSSANRSCVTIPRAPCFDLTASITLSAWVKVTSFTYEWQAVVAKGDGAYRLHSDTMFKTAYFSLTNADTAHGGFQDASGTTIINDHAWHLITGVFDGTVMRMYTDGKSEGTKAVSAPCLTDTMNVTIGENRGQSPRFFNGAIDEVRIMHASMSADWVKLCYMNQKQDNALVVFK